MGQSDKRDGEPELLILKGAIENTNEAFVTIDQHHTVVFFNRAAERIFGFPRDEVLGRDLSVIMTPRCSLDHKAAVARYLSSRTPRLIGHETSFLATRKNGERFPSNISFSVTEVKGTVYFTALVRDLSETKELEEKVSRAEKLASLGQFVAEITHEIKNPLMLIGGFSRQLLKEAPDSGSKKKLKIILDETRRLEDLLGELREFYRPRSLNLDEVEILRLVRDVAELAKDEAEQRNVRIDVSEEHARMVEVKGDWGKLKQVFLNVTKNGIEAMESGGDLSIRVATEGNCAVIAFTDTGSGIPEEIMNKIDRPFFTTKSRGTGLGIPVSKRIVEEHPGGSFHVASRAGKGTTVTITLPLYHPDASP